MKDPAATNARYPTRFERSILTKADVWLDEILTARDPNAPKMVPPKAEAATEADPRLILLCMTPRSGSTALSAALASTGQLGLGGERLNRKNQMLNEIAMTTLPRTKRDLLDRVIEASRTPNGVAQIKCDLPQLLPFLLDPDCYALLRKAHFVYLTRGDLLGQAISRHRSNSVGVAHTRVVDRTAGQFLNKGQAKYSFTAISSHLEHLTRMMAAYEKVFAMLGIRPMRLSYEQITAHPRRIVRDIAQLVGVAIKAAAISGLDAGGYKKVSGSNNDTLREQFLAEAPTHVFVPGHRAPRVPRRVKGGPARNK